MLKLNLYISWLFILLLPSMITACNSSNSNTVAVEKETPVKPLASKSTDSPNYNSPLGIGLNGISDWSTQLPFLDHFKSSRKWITQCVKSEVGCEGKWSTGEDDLLDLDENGWVKSLPKPEDQPQYTRVSTLLFRDIPNQFPGGKYLVLYDGEGTIEYGFAANKIEEESTIGRDVIEVDSSARGGILLTITATDTNKNGNYIRNIRVVEAKNESLFKQGEMFNPIFLKKIEKFRALRFMNWTKTNNSEQKEWVNRPTPETISYALKGAPIEVMVALSNKLKADPWFNMPHQATDEYITNFAQLVKDSLDDNLKVYVEFSNEVWNWQFKQAHYASEKGKARWGDKGDAYMQWYGMRTAQMCDIWKDVFATEKDRVVCIMGTQTVLKGLEKSALDCSYWVAEGNKPCYQHGIDAYAITGYFDEGLGQPENQSIVESWLREPDGGFAKAFQQLKQGGLLKNKKNKTYRGLEKDSYDSFIYHSNIAKERGLQLVAYEGGQHIVGRGKLVNNEQLTDFLIAVNRHPEMYDLYTILFDNWKKADGTLFMHFVDIARPSKYGSWGALEYLEQPSSPKYDALMDFIEHNPCWWDECNK